MSVLVFAESQWRHIEDWQFCYFVPVILGIIIYFDWPRLVKLPARGSWTGFPIVVAAGLVYLFGYGADIIYFGYASAQLMVAGLIILFLGWEWMMALGFAWLFMTFLWPLVFMTEHVSFPLRQIMSKTTVFVLNTIGIPSLLSGTAVVSASDALTHTPTGARFSVDVAVACSGIRSLFALTMISAVWAHFAVKGAVRKWIVFLASAPLAVLGNLCRILILIFGTLIFGSEFAIGGKDPSAFHEGAGYAVFAVGLGGLMVVTKIVNVDWIGWFDRFRSNFQNTSGPSLPPPPGGRRVPGKIEDVY